MWSKTIICLAVLVMGISAATGDTVFDNFSAGFGYNQTNGWTISKGAPLNHTWIQGDQFTPTASGTLSDVYFAMGFFAGQNYVAMTMLNDENGVPGTTALWSAEFTNQMGNMGDPNPPVHWLSITHISGLLGEGLRCCPSQ